MIRPFLLTLALGAAACSQGDAGQAPEAGADAGDQRAAAQTAGADRGVWSDAADTLFSAEDIHAHMAFLASDALEGREAGTRGYDVAAEYVASRFMAYGLKPAGADGSYMQPVTLREYRLGPDSAKMTVSHEGGGEETLDMRVDYIAHALAQNTETALTAPVVFAGYGITGGGRDDYANLDVDGKFVAVMMGAPEGMDSELAAHFASSSTKSRTAAEAGAAGILLLSPPAEQERYSFERMARYAGRPQMTWVGPDGQASTDLGGMQASATLSREGAAKLFEGARQSYEDVLAAAESGGEAVESFALPVTVSLSYGSEHEDVESANIVGVVEGTDPQLKDEYVILTAHLDHLGVSERVDERAINNGAMDNASGTAAMLEVARAAAEEASPRRSLLFLAVTAEEKGLIGSEYFAHNPTVPADSIVANINLDMPVLLYDFTDVIAFGAERSSLGPVTEEALADMGVSLTPDPMPEQRLFTRSDHYRFVQQGVPSLFLMTGFEGEGEEQFLGFLNGNYHTPGDNLDQPINYEAGAKFARANYEIMTEVANADQRPVWNEGDYFGELYGGPMEGDGGEAKAAAGPASGSAN